MASSAEGWSQGKRALKLMMSLKSSTNFSTLALLNIDQEDIFRTEFTLVNYLENVFILPCMQASWISVDFDNWRDWENEEDEGKEEYDRYVDVSISEIF